MSLNTCIVSHCDNFAIMYMLVGPKAFEIKCQSNGLGILNPEWISKPELRGQPFEKS